MSLETQVPSVPFALNVPWRWRKLILLSTMTCLVTAVIGTLFLPKTFQAQATLMLTSQSGPNSSGRPSFSIETVRNLMLADSVIGALRSRLIEAGIQGDTLTVGDLRRKLGISAYLAKESARAGESKYLPILRLEARAHSASQAAAIVNTWAEVFLAPDVNLIYLDRNRLANWISSDHSKALENLGKLEREILERSQDSRVSQLSIERKWSARLAAHAEATGTSIAGYRTVRSNFFLSIEPKPKRCVWSSRKGISLKENVKSWRHLKAGWSTWNKSLAVRQARWRHSQEQ